MSLRARMLGSIARPAAEGGQRMLATPVGTAQLARPDWTEVRRGWSGPLGRGAGERAVSDLEAELARRLEVPHIIAVANASVGLVLALEAAIASAPEEVRRRDRVALPSLSFRGLPGLPTVLSRRSAWCDVCEEGGVLDPESVERQADSLAAVLAVHNVHWRVDVQALEAVVSRAGVPLVFDSVYGMFGTARGRPCGSNGHAEVFSLHATKLVNGLEGGFVSTTRDDLAVWLRAARGDGGHGSGSRLSPLHARFALQSIDGVDDRIQANRSRYEAYAAALEGAPGCRLLPYQPGETHIYTSALVEVDEAPGWTRDGLLSLLDAEGILARRWYSPPLHGGPTAGVDVAPVSTAMSRRILQLPVGDRLDRELVYAIGGLVAGWAARVADGDTLRSSP